MSDAREDTAEPDINQGETNVSTEAHDQDSQPRDRVHGDSRQWRRGDLSARVIATPHGLILWRRP